MRSYQITQTVADRARGVIAVDRVGHGLARHWTTDEYEADLGELLRSDEVHVIRQFLLSDGTTRVFIVDVEGDGLPLFEEPRRVATAATERVAPTRATTSTWSRPSAARRLPGGVAVGPWEPTPRPPSDPSGNVRAETEDVSAPSTSDPVSPDDVRRQQRDQETRCSRPS